MSESRVQESLELIEKRLWGRSPTQPEKILAAEVRRLQTQLKEKENA